MNADDFVGGHSILALERFMDETRHMIIFDVLSWKSPVGEKCSGARSLANRARSVSNITPA